MSNKAGLNFKLKQNPKRKSSDRVKSPPVDLKKNLTQPQGTITENIPVNSRFRDPFLEVPSMNPARVQPISKEPRIHFPALEIPPIAIPALEHLPDEQKLINLFSTVISQSSTYVSKHFSQHPEASSILNNFYSTTLDRLNSRQVEYFKYKKSRLEEIEQELSTAKKFVMRNNQEWNEGCNKMIDRIQQLKSKKMTEEIKDIENKVIDAVRDQTAKASEHNQVDEGIEELAQKIREKQKEKVKELFQKAREVYEEVKERRKIEARNTLQEFSLFLPVINSDPVSLIEALSSRNINFS